jgi:hypothetical protein
MTKQREELKEDEDTVGRAEGGMRLKETELKMDEDTVRRTVGGMRL